jgi:hypothetical protein
VPTGLSDKALADIYTVTRSTTATYIDPTGKIRTAAIDVPRITYDPDTGESLGLLVEEARTNVLLNSDTLVTQSVTVAAVPQTLHFTGTGEVVLSGVATGTLTGTGEGEAQRVALTFTPTAGTLTLTVTGTVENSQLEAASTASSYIPTVASAVTRAADTVVRTLGDEFNAGEFTIVVAASTDATVFSAVSDRAHILTLASADNQNLFEILLFDTGLSILSRNDGSFSSAATVVNGSIGGGVVNNIAVRWRLGGECFAAMDGVMSEELSRAFDASQITTAIIGDARSSAGRYLDGRIKNIIYIPRALSDAELLALTKPES